MKKQTNFEKIRSMDKEELAEILNDICKEMDCNTCPFRNNKVCINNPFAEDFLDAEAENGKVENDMARYIDADALIKEMQECKYANPCNDYQRGVNASIDIHIVGIKHMPSADVVPRSEVARELKAFEEKVGRIYNHYVFEDTDYAEDDVAIEAVINALTEVLNDLSDLCQKYTEGEK